jgi:hypothetical protein
MNDDLSGKAVSALTFLVIGLTIGFIVGWSM